MKNNKSLIAMAMYVALVGSFLLINGCANTRGNLPEKDAMSENESPRRSEELGFGFKLIYESEGNVDGQSFEGLRHVSKFYYRDKYLGGSPGPYLKSLISPSGTYTIFPGEKGQIVLFDVKADRVRNLTTVFVGAIEGIRWNEAKKSATVFFFDGKPPLNASLDGNP